MNHDSFLRENSLFSRREFMGLTGKGCGAMGLTSAANTLLHQKLLGAFSSTGDLNSADEYKALICVFLFGGNDGMNCFLPNTDFDTYRTSRNQVALERADLHDSVTMPDYSFHPSLPFFRDAFDAGTMAVVGNIGTLIEPGVTASNFLSKPVPPQLFSHNDQQTQWQTSLPGENSTSGWGGRLADAAQFFNVDAKVSISASLGRDNIFSVGNRTTRLELNGGAVSLTQRGEGASTLEAAAMIRDLQKEHVFRKEFANIIDRGVESEILLGNVINRTPAGDEPGALLHAANPNEILFQQLRSVAQLINAREQLGVKRQIFFVNHNNFDTHGDQLTGHAERLTLLNDALRIFCEEIDALGLRDNVTTFTTTEFGRTYSSNANGTDHGWGNNHFVLGGSVDGGKIHNSLPSLRFREQDDAGFGRWIPSASTNEYCATLAKWFGVRTSDIRTIVPDLSRFTTGDGDLGFMKPV